jgi:benzaldehyde dehydrogenase (NAD)
MTDQQPVATRGLLIDGAWISASSAATFDRNDPFTGLPVTRAAAATVADAMSAARSAGEGFTTWRATPPAQRSAVLLGAADELVKRTEELAEIALLETGASLAVGRLSVAMAVENLRWAADQVDALQGRTLPSSAPGRTSLTFREPAGAVLVMAPWNGPIFQLVRSAVLPLALGNSVILRGSELSPRSHAAVAEAFVAAGAPAGTVSFLTNAPADSPAVISALIAAPAVKRVSFTGSGRVGSIIAAQAAQHFKQVVMELGDSSPLIVLADANIDDAVAAVAIGGFVYAGQGCIATERVLVDERVCPEFTDKLVHAVALLKSGDPRDEGTMIPPLISTEAVQRVHCLVTEAVNAGASVLCGGVPEGPCYPATVLSGVSPDMRIFHEETFGPVVTITTFDGPDEAVQLANDSAYGLSSAVFTRDVAQGLSVARRIDTGMCHINGPTVNDETSAPFGGVKQSGMGRHGLDGAIEAFTDVKWITIEAPQAGGPTLFGVSLS